MSLPSLAATPASSTLAADATALPGQTAEVAADTPPRTAPEARPEYLRRVLEDAEVLLKHVAESGIDIDDDVRAAVLKARAVPSDRWTEQIADDLVVALTKLAAKVRPVSAESLAACERAAEHSYWKVTLWVAGFIIPFSLVTFLTTAISEPIRKDIVVANDLAVKLTAQLGTSKAPSTARADPATNADVVTELQQFAATIRAIDTRARELNYFVLKMEPDPYESIRSLPAKFRDVFELPPGLPDTVAVKEQKIAVLQDVRYFAQSVLDDVSVFYGAITACILPMLYAILGTCAYLLRCFERETRAKTFIPSRANSARFMIAVISGGVVGLFNFNITEGASLSPLAIAFIVGYASDVFFSFLDALPRSTTAASPRPGGNSA